MPHKDIPSRQDIEALASARTPYSVSMYTPSGPLPADAEQARITLKNLARDAATQLAASGAPASVTDHLNSVLEGLSGDLPFWKQQAQSLAIFVTPDSVQTYRLPNRFTATVDVSDRFYIKPLMRTMTFPQSAFVLALAQNSVRLVHVTADQPAKVLEVADLPESAEAFFGDEPPERGTFNRAEYDEQVRVQQFAAAVNKAVYPVVRPTKLPLIIASADPLANAYRRANSYAFLSSEVLSGNPEALSADALAELTRPVLDRLYSAEIEGVVEQFEAREGQLMGSRELETVALGASMHAIDTLLVDFDTRVAGTLSDDGTVTYSEHDDAQNYGVVDEILRRALVVNARVYAVRSDEMPGGATVAATFRFPVS